jgi:hypothetical protein
MFPHLPAPIKQFDHYIIFFPPRRYPYFDVVAGLVLSYDPKSYAGSSVCTGRASMPDRSRVMTQTKRDTLALQVGG